MHNERIICTCSDEKHLKDMAKWADSQRGFGAMAALPRVDRFCYFRTLLARVENVLEAATSAICWTLAAS